jgi:hypothetical protein
VFVLFLLPAVSAPAARIPLFLPTAGAAAALLPSHAALACTGVGPFSIAATIRAVTAARALGPAVAATRIGAVLAVARTCAVGDRRACSIGVASRSCSYLIE